MGAVLLVFRAEFRRRWRSWLILVVLIAVVGGLTLAAAAAGRRTASAFPRFVAAHGYDVYIFNPQPVRGLATLPGVATVTDVGIPAVGQPTCSCIHHVINANDFYVNELSSRGLRRLVKLVAGRMPTQSSPDEVLASYNLQQDYGVHIGSVLHLPLYATSQGQALMSGANAAPSGPTIAVHVVGIEAAELEFPAGQGPEYDLFTTEAFARTRQSPHPAGRRVSRPAASRDRRPSPIRRRTHALPRGVHLQPGRIGAGRGRVDPPPGRGLVDTGRAGRAGRPGRRRAGARSPEHRRKRGVPEIGGPGPAAASAHHAGDGPKSRGSPRRNGRCGHRRLRPVPACSRRRSAPGRALTRLCLRSPGPPARRAGHRGGGRGPGRVALDTRLARAGRRRPVAPVPPVVHRRASVGHAAPLRAR